MPEDDESVEKLKDEVKDLTEKLEKMHDEQNVNQTIKNNGKNESTTLILSLVLGLIGLQGIGHMYVNRVVKGIGILICSLILLSAGIATVYAGIGILLLIIYLIMFVWQIFDARKLCHDYNLSIYKSISPRYSHHSNQQISHNEFQKIEMKDLQKNTKNRSWSKKKIIITVAAVFFALSIVAAITSFSIARGIIVLPQTQTANDNNSLSDYAIAYDKWRECAQKSGLSFCGNPPKSPFEDSPLDCISGSNDFRCNPYYAETHSGLRQDTP